MIELNKRAKLIWIDHHVTGINEMKHAEVEFLGVLGDEKNSKSAALLAWENFFPNKSIPKGIELISLFDTWQHEFKSEIMDFYTGLETDTGLSINSKSWEYIFENRIEFIQSITNSGCIINKYITSNNKMYALEHGFETTFEGYKAIVINRGFGGSIAFDAIWDEDKYDIMIAYSRRRNKMWKFSLYTTKKNIDCSAIAQRWGGGGHKAAAGFQTNETELPFKIV
jgi:oligoribonuclease NrnB/cAMP/cGMP phosphodiesterase (DHH superfamily)